MEEKKEDLHLLSILFRNPNFLILDEPTNDLDLPTLGVLENFLSEFPGCLVIVSHDRYFMDKLVDHLFVFEGDGVIRDFPGNYSQYRIWEKTIQLSNGGQQNTDNSNKNHTSSISISNKTSSGKKELSYKEKREFEFLENQIAELMKEKNTISEIINSGNLSFQELQQLSQRIAEVVSLLDEKELRWLELSEM